MYAAMTIPTVRMAFEPTLISTATARFLALDLGVPLGVLLGSFFEDFLARRTVKTLSWTCVSE